MSGALERVRRALVILLGRERGASRLAARASDVFLVSYPRSGNTWLRFLVGNLVWPSEPLSFLDLQHKVPDIYKTQAHVLDRMRSPRYLKSHEPYRPAYRNVIYLVRDPRDVLVSYYHYQAKFRLIPKEYPLDEFAGRFLDGGVDSYGPWNEHIRSWLGARNDSKGFLWLRYEDLQTDAISCLRQICRMLDVERSDEELATVQELSSFGRMQALEVRQHDLWEPTKGTNSEDRFIRSGRAGQWEEVLSGAIQARITEKWGQTMKALGYLEA